MVGFLWNGVAWRGKKETEQLGKSLQLLFAVLNKCDFALPGYEMYTTMRADPCLCFLERVGRPDDKAIDAEQQTGDGEMGEE